MKDTYQASIEGLNKDFYTTKISRAIEWFSKEVGFDVWVEEGDVKSDLLKHKRVGVTFQDGRHAEIKIQEAK